MILPRVQVWGGVIAHSFEIRFCRSIIFKLRAHQWLLSRHSWPSWTKQLREEIPRVVCGRSGMRQTS